MHVLIIPTSYPNIYNQHSGIFFRDQAEALAKHGHKVGVLAILPITIQMILKKKRVDFGLKIFIEENVCTYLFQFPVMPKSQKFQQLLRKWMGLILYKKYQKSNEKPDILHVHTYRAATTAINICTKYNIKYIITEHSSIFNIKFMKRFDDKIAQIAFSSSSLNIAVSEEFCKNLKLRYKKEFLYIPNVVDTNYFQPVLINKKNNCVNLLNIANLISQKNQIMLIKVFSKIKNRYPNAYLYIGGNGPERKNIENTILKYNLTESVFLLGNLKRDEVLEQMQKCDIFILPSISETFGVVLIEAMSCGKPVVTTKSGGPESIIVNSELGELVNNNEYDLYNGINKAVENIRNFDSLKIRNHVINNYSQKIIVEKLTNVYAEVNKSNNVNSYK